MIVMMHIHERCVCSIMPRNDVCSRRGADRPCCVCRSTWSVFLVFNWITGSETHRSWNRYIVPLIPVSPDPRMLMRWSAPITWLVYFDILLAPNVHPSISAFLQKPPPSLIHQYDNLPIPSPTIRIALTIKPSFCPSRDICRSDRTWECYYHHSP